MSSDRSISTNDTARRGWFKLDNALVDSGLLATLARDQIRVLVYLARSIDQRTGVARRKAETIGRHVGMCKEAVLRALKQLREFGILDWRRTGKASEYCLKPPHEWEVTGCRENVGDPSGGSARALSDGAPALDRKKRPRLLPYIKDLSTQDSQRTDGHEEDAAADGQANRGREGWTKHAAAKLSEIGYEAPTQLLSHAHATEKRVGFALVRSKSAQNPPGLVRHLVETGAEVPEGFEPPWVLKARRAEQEKRQQCRRAEHDAADRAEQERLRQERLDRESARATISEYSDLEISTALDRVLGEMHAADANFQQKRREALGDRAFASTPALALQVASLLNTKGVCP